MQEVELWTVVRPWRYAEWDELPSHIFSSFNRWEPLCFIEGRQGEEHAKFYRHKVMMARLSELPDGTDWWELDGRRRKIHNRNAGTGYVYSWFYDNDENLTKRESGLRGDFLVLVRRPRRPWPWQRVWFYRAKADRWRRKDGWTPPKTYEIRA